MRNSIHNYKSDLTSFQVFKNQIDGPLLANQYVFLRDLSYSFLKKSIYVVKYILSKDSSGRITIKILCYYGTRKLRMYKDLIFWGEFKNLTKEKNKMLTDFMHSSIIDNDQLKNTCLEISTVNRYIGDKKYKIYNFFKFRKYSSSFFPRQFDLYIDFIKLTALLLNKRISANIYLLALGKIFRFLPKRKHNQYVAFLKEIFLYLIRFKNSSILGAKFKISGRIGGKLRGNQFSILEGKMPTQSVDASISYSKLHVYTFYGCFGLKLWLNFR